MNQSLEGLCSEGGDYTVGSRRKKQGVQIRLLVKVKIVQRKKFLA